MVNEIQNYRVTDTKPAKRFEDLWIWQEARKLVKEIYQDFRLGNGSRDYGFRGQIQDAGVSIMNNIAEGFERTTDPDFARFLDVAKGSCGEVRSMYYTAEDLGYIDSLPAGTRRSIGNRGRSDRGVDGSQAHASPRRHNDATALCRPIAGGSRHLRALHKKLHRAGACASSRPGPGCAFPGPRIADHPPLHVYHARRANGDPVKSRRLTRFRKSAAESVPGDGAAGSPCMHL